ncbi:hypothetical protein LINGRAHAP2_LOCUS29007 [Linum grandiflorum]
MRERVWRLTFLNLLLEGTNLLEPSSKWSMKVSRTFACNVAYTDMLKLFALLSTPNRVMGIRNMRWRHLSRTISSGGGGGGGCSQNVRNAVSPQSLSHRRSLEVVSKRHQDLVLLPLAGWMPRTPLLLHH